MSEDEKIIYAANVGLGIALAGQGNFEEADARFAESTRMNPNGVSGYYYWARALKKQNRNAESKAILETVERNAKQIVKLPRTGQPVFLAHR